jgi:hypothetical protein
MKRIIFLTGIAFFSLKTSEVPYPAENFKREKSEILAALLDKQKSPSVSSQDASQNESDKPVFQRAKELSLGTGLRTTSLFGIAEHMSEPKASTPQYYTIACQLLNLAGCWRGKADLHQLIYNWRYPGFGFDEEMSKKLIAKGLLEQNNNTYSIPPLVASYLTLRAYRKLENQTLWDIDIFPEDICTVDHVLKFQPVAVTKDKKVVVIDAHFWNAYCQNMQGSCACWLDTEKFRNDVYRIHVPTAARESFLHLLKKFQIQESFIDDVLIKERPYRK